MVVFNYKLIGVILSLFFVINASPVINVKCTSISCQNISATVQDCWQPTRNPCIDFYDFACGNFNNSQPLPESKRTWSNFLILQDKVEKDLVGVLQNEFKTSSSDDAPQKVRQMFSGCMDTNSRDTLGIQPLWDLISSIGGWTLLTGPNSGPQSWLDHASIIADYGVSLYFDIKIRSDPFNGSTNAIYITVPGLEFPTMLVNEGNEQQINSENEQVAKMFLKKSLKKSQNVPKESPFTYYILRVALYLKEKLNLDISEDLLLQKSRAIIKLMQDLYKAKSQLPMQISIDSVISIETMQAWADEKFPSTTNKIDWLSFLRTTFKHSDIELNNSTSLYLIGPSAFENILQILYSTDPQTLSDLVVSRLITYFASQTDSYMQQLVEEFYVNASMPVVPKWQHCLHLIHQPTIGLSLATTYLYVNSLFDDDILSQVKDMSDDLKTAFKELVHEAEWLDETTRNSVYEKLDGMLMMLGYPDEVSSLELLNAYYQKLTIDPGNHFNNVVNLRQFSQSVDFNTVGRPRNSKLWSQSPLSINAYYTSLINRLMIPIAIMQQPFFVGKFLGALDYGRLGAIVGHEITHGFDANGRGRDENGDPDNSWSNSSIEEFNKRAKCFENQYDSYIEPITNTQVNGTITLNENTADNGGLRVAFRAFQKLRDRNPRFANALLPGFEEFDSNQLFFFGYASTWCQSASPEGLSYQMSVDNHAPNRFRVIGPLSNMKEFAKAFNCPRGYPMNPKNKCILW